MLHANQITIQIGSNTILNKVSLSLHPGELLVVVGPNGSGKSTLIRALSGDIKVNEGTVSLNGKRLDSWSMSQQAKIRGTLSQNVDLAFEFSVREVVMMGRCPYRRKKNVLQDHKIVDLAMQLTDTDSLADRIYPTLSGGEKQRVQLARVLAQIWEPVNKQARYLLLDEPTSALDLAHQHTVLAIARHFAERQGVGVLAILHDLNLAAVYADRIALFEKGCLIDVDIPENILCPKHIGQVFQYSVLVTSHPTLQNRPLIVPEILTIM